MVPNYHEEYRMPSLQLLHLTRMMRRIEIHDDDVTRIVGIVREIAEIREDMEVVEETKVRPVSPVSSLT